MEEARGEMTDTEQVTDVGPSGIGEPAEPGTEMAADMAAAAAPTEPAESTASAESAASDRASIHQGLVREVAGREVHLVQSAAGAIQADDVSLVQSAVALVRAEEVSVSMGGAGLIAGDRIRVAQGGAQSILARESVSIEQGGAGVVMAANVEVHPQTVVGFLIAGKVTGDVRTLFDWRGALAFGAAVAVLGRILGSLRRR